MSTVRADLMPGADGVAIAPAPAQALRAPPRSTQTDGWSALVAPRPQVVAGPSAAGAGGRPRSQPRSIKALLAKQGSAPASGRASLEAAKAAVVRVICVRE